MSNEPTESKNDQRQFWQMVLETFQSSGLSIRQFCRQEGLSAASFYSWRKRLTKADEPKADTEKASPSESFIQVTLPTDKPGGLELVLTSGNILKISVGTDRKTLTDVLSILQQAQLC